MEIAFLLLLLGLAVLAKSSVAAVDAATKLSQITGISRTVIGFIFIGVATSLPELFVAVISSFEGKGAISMGNLLGANITNLTLILGFMAFIGFNLGKIYSRQFRHAIVITASITGILFFMGTAGLLFGVFLLCVYYLVSIGVWKDGFVMYDGVNASNASKPMIRLIVYIAMIVMSAYVVTNSAISIAGFLGLSSAIIGATIISIGTTMPELSVNIAAVRKRNISLAIGDTVGTITTNLALVLGVATAISPVAISQDILFLAAFLMAVCLVAYFMANRTAFGVKEAMILLLIYVIYVTSSLVFGAVR